jgi:THO complex subunit 1
VWNLLDILSILSDDERCDPALPFWIIEELLDSQTIAGCQQIFDFLESRRERITARHFKQKQLIILRSCNELLRRLSRAEDTGFCGRVFIFMFQSFPLGDKSSVNLRGEYHVENVTTYDQEPASAADDEMDTDDAAASKLSPPTTTAADASKKADAAAAAAALKPSELYPIFWSLQESFSQPKKLFDAAHFAQFRTGFEATMAAFRQVQSQQGTRQSRTSSDDARRGVKRKRDGDEGSGGNAFNPKYLTSRDLFELEVSALGCPASLQAHVLTGYSTD